MKSVLIGVRPEWCKKIASGEKTIEERKTKPKLETPFKCYIYCSYGKGLSYSGKVIGEFVCDRITNYYPFGLRGHKLSKETLTAMCLSIEDLNKYGKLDLVYGWHISDLKIYDKPKELSEFNLTRPPQSWCYVEELSK